MPEGREGAAERGYFASTAARVKKWGEGDWDILLIIILMATALRIYFAVAGSAAAALDGEISITALADLAPKGAMDTLSPPLLPLVHFFMASLPGSGGASSLYLFQAILSSISVLLIYNSGRRMFGRRTGLVAAAVAALYPGFIFINLKTGADPILLVLAISITALAASSVGERIRSGGLALLSGISMMVSPVAVFFVPGALLSARRRIVFIAVLAATLMPWTLRNSSRMRTFIPVYDTSAYTVSLDKYRVVRDGWRPVHRLYIDISYIFARSWDEDRDAETTDPGRRNSNHTATWAYTLVIFLGVAGMIRHLGRRQLAAVLPMVTTIALLVFLTDFEMRSRIVLVPILMIFTASLFTARRDLDEKGPADSRPLIDPDESRELFEPVP